MAEGPFRLIGIRHVHRGALLRTERHHYVWPHGPMVRELVRHPGSVAVLPVVGDQVVLVRQYRAPIRRPILEIPAGLRDDAGETPETTAARECEEETGLRPGSLKLLHRFYNSPGFTDEYSWLYLAEELQEVGSRPQGAEERSAEVVRMDWEEAHRLMQEGGVEDVKTVVALYALGAMRGWL